MTFSNIFHSNARQNDKCRSKGTEKGNFIRHIVITASIACRIME